jgi:hypothetical protein
MEKIHLQSFCKATECLDLNTLETVSKKKDIRTVGWYNYLDNVFSALYFNQNVFFVRFGSLSIRVDEGVAAVVKKSDGKYQFDLYRNDHLELSFKYSINSQSIPHEFDFTPFAQKEDFDWGLFICNIINNKSRRSNIIAYYEETKLSG